MSSSSSRWATISSRRAMRAPYRARKLTGRGPEEERQGRRVPGVPDGHEPVLDGRVLLRPAPRPRGRGDRAGGGDRGARAACLRGRGRDLRRGGLRDAADGARRAVLQGCRRVGAIRPTEEIRSEFPALADGTAALDRKST